MYLLHNAFYRNNMLDSGTHFHDCHQIIYVKEGTIAVTINNKYNLVSTPSIIIINRFDEHSIKILGDKYERYVIRISFSLEPTITPKQSTILNLFAHYEHFNHIIPINNNVEHYNFYFYNLIDEYTKKDNYSYTICEDILYNIASHIFRSFPTFFNLNEHGKTLINTIEQDILNNISSKFTLDELSKKYHISKSYLSHLFKKQTGYSLVNYILCCRISTAKKMLTKTNLSIGEICEKIGCSDHSNFSRLFKKQTNLTPKEFREKYK